MSNFNILITNHVFRMAENAVGYKSIEAARRAGLETAIAILGDEILAGSPTAVVEISVLNDDGVIVARSAVGTSVAPLLPTTQTPRFELGSECAPQDALHDN